MTYSEMFFTDFPDLKAVHFITYLRLLDLSSYDQDLVLPSYSKLAYEVGAARQTIPSVIDRLEQVGLIKTSFTSPVMKRIIQVL